MVRGVSHDPAADLSPDWRIAEEGPELGTCAWCGARADAEDVLEVLGARGELEELVLCAECWGRADEGDA